ncbi:hypothetical protein GCK32_001130 [Trichostrongylus colubriformis]|uniref:Secreted protein n=1 Tax=Trichostrongylus colubriformis TaxID=6319 RepID=A0AAN8G4R3_TRICO
MGEFSRGASGVAMRLLLLLTLLISPVSPFLFGIFPSCCESSLWYPLLLFLGLCPPVRPHIVCCPVPVPVPAAPPVRTVNVIYIPAAPAAPVPYRAPLPPPPPPPAYAVGGR